MRVSYLVITALFILAPRPAAAERTCREEIAILGATATYQTRMFQGKPTRRDVIINIEVRSTATAAVSKVELAVFLGASLRSVQGTRPEGLPTGRPRTFEDGGLAFRADVHEILKPGTSRTLEVRRKALPMDRDITGVTVRVLGCSKLYPVTVGIVDPPREKKPLPPSVWGLSAGLIILIFITLFLLRRR